jgi:hypothetical protein
LTVVPALLDPRIPSNADVHGATTVVIARPTQHPTSALA